ncbi:MAG: AI-2E family transporter [Gemmatimonadota bacterium]|nr:MAG: AI-2E family transporter [Gemmatimonadota bacterium]
MILGKAETSGTRFLLVAAAAVVVVAGLKLGAPILLPFALALFLAVMSLPITFWLQRHVPPWLSILITVLVTVTVFSVLILLTVQSFSELEPRLDGYRTSLTQLGQNAVEWVGKNEFLGSPAVDRYLTLDVIEAGAVFDFLGGAVRQAGNLVSTTFLVLLMMVFMLAEATVFPYKLRAILRPKAGSGRRMTKVIREVQVYLGIKTAVSLVTGLLIGTWAWLLGLDFPVLLGLIGFVLNYVPTIGSILAVIPALFLSLVQFGSFGHSVLVLGGYLFINMVFGNIIEPNLMGRRLGLSTLVVILSLIFWAWVWGPIGALLAVPLTMVVRIMLENTEDLHWVAVLLDKSPPQARLAVAGAGTPPPPPPLDDSTLESSADAAEGTGEAGAA